MSWYLRWKGQWRCHRSSTRKSLWKFQRLKSRSLEKRVWHDATQCDTSFYLSWDVFTRPRCLQVSIWHPCIVMHPCVVMRVFTKFYSFLGRVTVGSWRVMMIVEELIRQVGCFMLYRVFDRYQMIAPLFRESLTWKCFKMLYLWLLCLSEILEFSGPCPCDPVHRTKLRLYIALWSVIPRKWDIFFADMDIAEKILIHLWKYYLWMFSGQTRAKAELASCGESRSMSSSPSRGAQCTKLPVSF